MPLINLKPAAPLPPDRYLVQIDTVIRGTTKRGDEMWSLKLVVVDGEHAGTEIWDRIVFSQAARRRVATLCIALRIATQGQVELDPSMLKGKRVIVQTQVETYMDEQRPAVTFDGYSPAPEPEPTPF